MSQGQLGTCHTIPTKPLTVSMAQWNPFEDTTPFGEMSEDHIFVAEFDKLRRGSQSSEFHLMMLHDFLVDMEVKISFSKFAGE